MNKRLIVCCDGTWKRSDDLDVSNVEKIARAINIDPEADGPLQVVHYTAGVGTGATRVERAIGGGLGVGLDISLIGAYRFLALNYSPGDEIFVFGFSRGAYTARSLVGMIDTIGLLTRAGIAGNKLHEAIDVYRGRPKPGAVDPVAQERVDRFRKRCYKPEGIEIRFLGVFDTVGALGIPGVSRRRKQRLHCVEMPCTIKVVTARQALALDERRRAFTPAVWSQNKGLHPDLKQVWFDGVHSDIGGGYPESNLSDRTLLWMLGEAYACGLRFDEDLIVPNLQLQTVDPRHDSLKVGYKMYNAFSIARRALRLNTVQTYKFKNKFRDLETMSYNGDGDPSIRIADVAYRRWEDGPNGLVQNPNVATWVARLWNREIDVENDRVEMTPDIPANGGPIVWVKGIPAVST